MACRQCQPYVSSEKVPHLPTNKFNLVGVGPKGLVYKCTNCSAKLSEAKGPESTDKNKQ